MAALVLGNKSKDLLSVPPLSMPQNNSLVNKAKESDASVRLLQEVGKTKSVGNNNISPAIPLKEGTLMFQDIRFLYPIPPTTGNEITAQNEYICASDRLKADPNIPWRKRQRIFKSDTQPSSQSMLVTNQGLSSWLEKPSNDEDADAEYAAVGSQTLLEGSETDLSSTRKFSTKPSNVVLSSENVFPILTSSTTEAQGSSMGSSPRSKKLVSTDVLKEDTIVMTNMKKKMLKLNSMGKLSSPPSRTIMSKMELFNGTGKCSAPVKLIVVLKYGHREETRRKVAKIVGGNLEACTLSKLEHHGRAFESANQAKPDKLVHPFFTSRRKSKANADAERDYGRLLERSVNRRDELQLKECAVTPGKLRAQRQNCVGAIGRTVSSTSFPNSSARDLARSGGGFFSWPSKANLHVRGPENAMYKSPFPHYLDNETFKENRKLKGNFVTIPRGDNIMIKLSKDLHDYTSLNRTAALRDHTSWRAPTREVTTGPDLVKWFSQELLASRHATIPRMQQREDIIDVEKVTMHPALKRLYSETEDMLTPFDEFACESILWASKYSPRTADQVLQSENRAQVLRNWLRRLTLQTSHNRKSLNIASSMATNRNSVSRRTRPKKKRKVDRLEGFIASSDEESNDREELSETASDNSLAISTNCNRKSPSMISGCDDLSNSVLISGPHGCGKTAAVYAAAEELGFEVFEVNPGMRRSGKDLLDKVGEMAENHLVRPVMDPSVSSNKTKLEMEELSAKETDIVGQKSMKSFFETKVRPLKSKNKVKDNHKANLCRSDRQIQRSAPRQQKQSLILLEEADVLFEKDKQFWPTVVSLLAYSKRPIIMTCTDERFIPHDLIKFQLNLRFTPPPRDITIEYLTVLAGKEGHKLSWEAVSSIYSQTNQDLRACIMNLNFWCQMGVGDKKGGLDWMISRWPAGVDLDRFGRKLRVVSNNTYRKEMGLISSDLYYAKNSVIFDRDCELLRDAHTDTKVDLELLYDTFERRQPYWNSFSKQHLLQERRSTYEQIVDAQIMSDIWSFTDCFLEEPLNPTSIFLPDTMRADTPEGVSILPVETIENFNSFANHLAITTILLSRQLHPKNNDEGPGSTGLPVYVATKATPKRCQEVFVSKHGSSLTSALSPLATDSTTYTVLTSHTQSILASEVAPYVRAISAYDQALEIQRASRLASFGGRLTRAARSVAEGVERGKVRQDRWIPGLNFVDVLQTAGPSWRQNYGIAKEGEEEEKEKHIENFLDNKANDPMKDKK